MSPILALRLVTYLLVCDGVAGLLLAGLIGAFGAALVVLAMLGSWWLERARAQGIVRAWMAWGLVGAAAVAIAMDLVYLAATALDGMVHLLLFLILARLFLRRSLRDLRDASFLSFFLLVATSSATFGVGFLVVFMVFLLLATWMLMLHHVAAETERASGPDGRASTGRVDFRGRLARVSLVGAAATLVITGMLFFVIPRMGQATLPLRNKLGRMVTGFSDRVELGAFGEIESDKTVIMRVYVTDDTLAPALLPDLRWRGIVFDRFDGRTWAVGQPDRIPVRRWPNGRFLLAAPLGRGPLLKQDIYLDPIGTDIVFAAPRALRLSLPTGIVHVDDMGSLSMPNLSDRLHYQVESELEVPPALPVAGRGAGAGMSGATRNRYLQLPALSPRIARLAREATMGSRDSYEAAEKLSQFLSTRYRYALAKPETSLDPLEEFLFTRGSGNCEYFAAAMAVMLRTLDVPARVVGGFQRGEWNPYGRYFMVRLSDAHAWVEAYFDGPGWVTFDPSPRGSARLEDQPSALALYLDAARMRWYRYVVNWSLQDQRLFASTVQRQAKDVSLALAWPTEWRSKLWFLIPAAVGAVVALGWMIWRFGPVGQTRQTGMRPPRFYERALRALARRGLNPEPAETARQFWARARHATPACAEPLARITSAYERVRFGLTEPTEDEMREVERSLLALERR
jgi:transglutaminase-like putative cysteine protease